MKNVHASMLKKCICVSLSEFEHILHKAFNDENLYIDIGYEGVDVYSNDDDDAYEIPWTDICEKLAEYFDVAKVTSYHADDCDHTAVWIVYRDENDEN